MTIGRHTPSFRPETLDAPPAVRPDAWIQTRTNRAFPFDDPSPDDVEIHDIAVALSRICRFGGHSSEFYSVAQHSVLVSQVVPSEHALWGLLHDAAEAYIGDMVAPIKRLPEMEPFRALERRVQRAIRLKFELDPVMPPEVKRTDLVLFATEKRDLLGPEPKPFLPLPEPLEQRIVPWSPKVAQAAFLGRFNDLTGD